MKPLAWFSVGAAIGLLAGAGVFLVLKTAPPGQATWQEQASAHNLPNRRAYALPLNNPDMIVAAQAAHMRDDDVVLGVIVRGQARAYPWWLVSNYHVVNDTVEHEPMLIVLCEVCGGAAAFRPSLPDLPGIPLSFQLSGVGLGTIEISDHQTLSKWRPFLGVAFDGPLKGRSLERHPLLLMTWMEWRQLYADSLVANGSPQLRQRAHGAESGRIGDPDLQPPFDRTANLADRRLATHELVFGVAIPETGKAYAVPVRHLTPFPNLFRVMIGEKPVLLVRQGELAISAFDLGPTPYRAPFALVSKVPIRFRTPDAVVWDVFGRARTSDGREVRLPGTQSYLTEWYEWVSHSPESAIVNDVEVWSAE